MLNIKLTVHVHFKVYTEFSLIIFNFNKIFQNTVTFIIYSKCFAFSLKFKN